MFRHGWPLNIKTLKDKPRDTLARGLQLNVRLYDDLHQKVHPAARLARVMGDHLRLAQHGNDSLAKEVAFSIRHSLLIEPHVLSLQKHLH